MIDFQAFINAVLSKLRHARLPVGKPYGTCRRAKQQTIFAMRELDALIVFLIHLSSIQSFGGKVIYPIPILHQHVLLNKYNGTFAMFLYSKLILQTQNRFLKILEEKMGDKYRKSIACSIKNNILKYRFKIIAQKPS
jgi:hypothetical protein